MPDIALKLTVYKPATMAGPGEQVGFEYDLTIVLPDLKTVAVKGGHVEASSAKCTVIPVTGTLSLPNPAVPVISPFKRDIFAYDNSPAIAFPLTMMGTAPRRP